MICTNSIPLMSIKQDKIYRQCHAYNCTKYKWVPIAIATDVTDDKPQAIIDEAMQVEVLQKTFLK